MEENIKPQLEIKPKFNLLCTFIDKHLLTTLAIIILLSITYKQELLKVYILIIILYIVYVLVNLFINNRKCKKTSYLFYEDRVVIKEKSNEDEIFYDEVKDFLLYQSPVQKIFHYGEITIKLKNDNILSKGIQLFSLSDITNTVEKIRQVVYNN